MPGAQQTWGGASRSLGFRPHGTRSQCRRLGTREVSRVSAVPDMPKPVGAPEQAGAAAKTRQTRILYGGFHEPPRSTRPVGHPLSPSLPPCGRRAGDAAVSGPVFAATQDRDTHRKRTVAWLCWGANRGLHTRESARRQGNVLLSSSTKRWLLK